MIDNSTIIINPNGTIVNSHLVQSSILTDQKRQIYAKLKAMHTEPELQVDRMNDLMRARRMSAKQLALYSGVSYDTIRKIRQELRPGTSGLNLAKLAATLRCSVDYLMGVTDNPAPYGLQGTPEETQRLIVALASLTPARREDLARIADALHQTALEEQAALIRELRSMTAMLEFILAEWGLEAHHVLLDTFGRPVGLSSADILARLNEPDDLASLFGDDETPDDETESGQ